MTLQQFIYGILSLAVRSLYVGWLLMVLVGAAHSHIDVVPLVAYWESVGAAAALLCVAGSFTASMTEDALHAVLNYAKIVGGNDGA